MKLTMSSVCGALALAVSTLAAPAYAGGFEGRSGAAVPVPAPAPVPDYYGNYYLRLDLAYDWADADRFVTGSDLYNPNRRRDDGLSEGGRFGFGIGAYLTKWLRADATFDVREEASGYVNDQILRDDGTSATTPNTNVADTLTDRIRYRNGVFLANGYIDLPFTPHFVPYIGAGVGTVLHSMSRELNQNITCTPTAPANDPAACSSTPGYSVDNRVQDKNYQFALATAVMAGVAFQVTDSIKTDIGYRWLHLDGASFSHWVGQTYAYQTVKIPDQNIHEMRIGLRWDIQ